MAQTSGNDRVVYRLVHSPVAAAHIIAYGAILRSQAVSDYHVRPSLTLGDFGRGILGAAFYILGKNRSGNLALEETLELRIERGVAVVVRDDPGEEW